MLILDYQSRKILQSSCIQVAAPAYQRFDTYINSMSVSYSHILTRANPDSKMQVSLFLVFDGTYDNYYFIFLLKQLKRRYSHILFSPALFIRASLYSKMLPC